jgi:Cu(I)/Ag(I) efflux system protein CusF
MFMRKKIQLFLTTSLFFLSACGGTTTFDHSEHAASSKPTDKNAAETITYHAVGVIEKLDAANSKITLRHEQIGDYMPPMTMEFAVRDPKSLENLKTGEKVDFWLERRGANVQIIEIDRAETKPKSNGGYP